MLQSREAGLLSLMWKWNLKGWVEAHTASIWMNSFFHFLFKNARIAPLPKPQPGDTSKTAKQEFLRFLHAKWGKNAHSHPGDFNKRSVEEVLEADILLDSAYGCSNQTFPRCVTAQVFIFLWNQFLQIPDSSTVTGKKCHLRKRTKIPTLVLVKTDSTKVF